MMIQKSWWQELITETIQRTSKQRARPEPGNEYNFGSHDPVTYFPKPSPRFLRLAQPPTVATPAVEHEPFVGIAYTNSDSLTTFRLFLGILLMC